MKNVKYSTKVINGYIKKYQCEMNILANWNSHNLKYIASNLLYGIDNSSNYIQFFKLSLFEQCIYFCRYGIPYFISLK